MVHIGTYLLHEVIKVTAQNDKGLPQYPNSHFSIVSPSTDALHHLYLDLFTSCLWRYFLLVRLFSNPYNSPKLQPPLNYSPAENVSSSNQAGLKSGAIAQRILLAPRGCVWLSTTHHFIYRVALLLFRRLPTGIGHHIQFTSHCSRLLVGSLLCSTTIPSNSE